MRLSFKEVNLLPRMRRVNDIVRSSFLLFNPNYYSIKRYQ